MNELNDFLKNEIDLSDNSIIVIGLSGGPDSMALLNILSKFNSNLKIVCAHVHHNLRKESDMEKIFVEEYCQKNGYIFEFLKIEEYKNNKFSEEEARRIRYDFFESLVYKYNAKYLFTAHHGDDLIETVLMRLTRGSTLKGYSGISTITKKERYEIIRPLIFLTKDEVMNYINDNHIPYVVDNSNTSLKYTRNRYRAQILPILKKENPIVHQKFYKYSKMIEQYDDFVNKYVDNIYNKIVIDGKIYIDKFTCEEKLIRHAILERYIYFIYGDDIVFWDDMKTELFQKMAYDLKPNISLDFPNNIKGIKEYNLLYMIKPDTSEEYEYEIKDKVELKDGIIEKVSESNETDNYVTYLNSSDIKLPIYVRTIKNGDKITIKNMQGTKKIKDIFINEKIPMIKRKIWPIVVDSQNNVLWIPGLKKSKFDSQKTGKYDIILKYYYEGR
ncbi:MAG: tRNA lysidine(34) synthetase TilS [Bacilli bacterium]|nr:tRNA lysidine(34) synthetase TilS [Bacilli bacterium]